jgi:hypothetical protein
MPSIGIKKLVFKSGVNRENTRYYTEGGWYDCDKIRFRQGSPQKLGGWNRISSNTFEGVCRSLWAWETLGQDTLIGIGTNSKFYISRGGAYYDITPIDPTKSANLTNPFTATNGSTVITVAASGHGAINGDYVTYNGASPLGGTITAAVLNTEHQITYIDANSYSISVSVAANSLDTGKGGTVRAVYQINVGPEYQTPVTGWGAGAWGSGSWGSGQSGVDSMRLWSQSNYGQDLIFGPRGGAIYYYYADRSTSSTAVTSITVASPAVITVPSGTYTNNSPIVFETTSALPTGLSTGTVYYIRNYVSGVFNVSLTPSGSLITTTVAGSGTQYISNRAVNLTTIDGASDVPTIQNYITVSDTFRFVFAFGCNDYGVSTQSPLLVRWSDQENAADWTPSVTNQAGSLTLTRGSQIITALQTRQEILVWTDSTLYSMQYLGYPLVWSAQLMGDNISIIGENAAALASGVVYWMGRDKFYKYDGRVQTQNCDLREYVFNNFNSLQNEQVFASTNEGFNEVWWFYCSVNSTEVDKYVVYNYAEDIWFYGTMGRTAWLDSGILEFPLAATYTHNLVNHESGLDNNETAVPTAIESYITSSETDIDDGHNFVFIRRVLPDLTFRGSTTTSPTATLSIIPLMNSGSGYTDPASVGGSDSAAVTRTATVPIEQFTGQVFIRVRGRQFSFKIENNQLGSMWQLGAIRLDIKQDGQRG